MATQTSVYIHRRSEDCNGQSSKSNITKENEENIHFYVAWQNPLRYFNIHMAQMQSMECVIAYLQKNFNLCMWDVGIFINGKRVHPNDTPHSLKIMKDQTLEGRIDVLTVQACPIALAEHREMRRLEAIRMAEENEESERKKKEEEDKEKIGKKESTKAEEAKKKIQKTKKKRVYTRSTDIDD